MLKRAYSPDLLIYGSCNNSDHQHKKINAARDPQYSGQTYPVDLEYAIHKRTSYYPKYVIKNEIPHYRHWGEQHFFAFWGILNENNIIRQKRKRIYQVQEEKGTLKVKMSNT